VKPWAERAVLTAWAALLLWDIWDRVRCPVCGENKTHTHSILEAEMAGAMGHPGLRRIPPRRRA
jgi:hypothetical protein